MSILKCGCAPRHIGDSPEYQRSKKQERFDAIGGVEKASPAIPFPQMEAVDPDIIDFQPDPSHYSLGTVIGSGCDDYVNIFLAKHLPSDATVAIKRISLEENMVDSKHVKEEIIMMRQLQNDNILPCLCSFVHESHIWIVVPLMAYGSTKDLLGAHFVEGMSELAIAYILRDILQALEYLHQLLIIHRSIRSSHILISANGHVALSGLRYCTSMYYDAKRNKKVFNFPSQNYDKALNWASPELLEQNLSGYDTKSDIYSIGITACELANGAAPFADMPPTQMLLEKLDGTMPRLLDSTTIPELQMEQLKDEVQDGLSSSEPLHIPYQRTLSPEFHHFVEQCLQYDPNQRPTASALLQHSFFKQVKRKSGIDVLPELLKPVVPLSEEIAERAEDPDLDALADSMDTAEIDDRQWAF